jgi:hypothetical protein
MSDRANANGNGQPVPRPPMQYHPVQIGDDDDGGAWPSLLHCRIHGKAGSPAGDDGTQKNRTSFNMEVECDTMLARCLVACILAWIAAWVWRGGSAC